MKFINSKLIQKPEGRKTGKYRITIELTDYDIEMLEEFGVFATAGVTHWEDDNENARYHKMEKYLRNLYHHIFQKLWRVYDF